MAGNGAGGYEVQQSGMTDEADKLREAGDDVGHIRKAVDVQVCYPADTLGGSDSGPAHENFGSAWQAEAKVLEAALHELAGKVELSRQNYEGADDIAVSGLQSAVGGPLTTMPAPATLPRPGITTGLVPGEAPASIGSPPVVGGPAPARNDGLLGEPPVIGGPAPGAPPPSLADFD